MCSKACKAACIDYKNHTVDYSRCVVCGDCISSCKFGALKYDNSKFHQKAHSSNHTTDEGKRSFLLATAMATTAALAQEKKKVDGGLAEIEDKVAPVIRSAVVKSTSLPGTCRRIVLAACFAYRNVRMKCCAHQPN